MYLSYEIHFNIVKGTLKHLSLKRLLGLIRLRNGMIAVIVREGLFPLIRKSPIWINYIKKRNSLFLKGIPSGFYRYNKSLVTFAYPFMYPQLF